MRTLLLAAILTFAPTAFGADWSFLGSRDGVSTWSREIAGTKLLGFRGESEVDVHISRMVAAMLDPARTPEWVDLLTEHRVIEPGTLDRQVVYQRYGMAWPVADRDLVFERTVQQFPDQHRTTVTIRSTTHPMAPEVPGVVRADVTRTYFSFTALPGGRTRVEVEAFTDPKGIVPLWLVNLVQKNWARKSITALVGLARKDEIQPFEPARSW